MGFYGNITNTSRTTFQFDRIYSSRSEMDNKCSSDGIYIGRYVLVEYDKELSNSDFKTGWYLVTDKGRNIVYSSIVSGINSTDDNYYNYFIGGDGIVQTGELDTVESKTLYFPEKKHFTVLRPENSEIKRHYIKINRDNTFTQITEAAFLEHYGESSFPEDSESLPSACIVVNGTTDLAYPLTDEFNLEEDVIWAYVPVNQKYKYNTEPEVWTINKEASFTPDPLDPIKDTYEVNQLSTSSNYVANYELDKRTYNASRGYDSTVWQKVYSDKKEKYVMIAELNTVIPSFGVSADPPSLAPISPHFGVDSTNAYYELHWQPSWGFRIKAADNGLKIPTILQNGRLREQDSLQIQGTDVDARDDELDGNYYPSDEKVFWKHTFEDRTLFQDSKRKTLYLNGATGQWSENPEAKVSSAIYFNRKGFDPKEIFYSADLNSEESRKSSWRHYNPLIKWDNDDSILITPSGRSGTLYNKHDGSIDKTAQIDTQELSIMLPSIGNTMAKVWDLIYGGRETSDYIKRTSQRNINIAWEDAKGELSRAGLRLTGIFGDEYNRKQVDTLAGSINTAHDLLGMIISSNTEEEVENVNNLDENRIYFVTKDSDSSKGIYYRKHKTFEYTITDNFVYKVQDSEELTQADIDSGLYYKKNNNNYEIAEEYNPNEIYYLKFLEEDYIPVENVKSFPIEGPAWYYRDYLGGNSKILNDLPAGSSQEKLSDYIYDTVYHEGRDYYTLDNVTQVTLNGEEYQPNRYWYLSDNNSFLRDAGEKKDGRIYYEFDNPEQKLVNLKKYYTAGIYIPGVYYYKRIEDNGTYSYVADISSNMSCNGDRDIGKAVTSTDPAYIGQIEYYMPARIEYDSSGNKKIYTMDTQYEQVNSSDLNAQNFIPGKYYEKNGVNYYPASEYNNNTVYYIKLVKYKEITNDGDVYTIDTQNVILSGSLRPFVINTFFKIELSPSGEIIGIIPVSITELQLSQDNSFDNIWVLGAPDSNNNFRNLSAALQDPDFAIRQDAFYQKNTYHYKTGNPGSYILDTSEFLDPNKTYYRIDRLTKVNNNYTFYVPNKYYIETDENEEGYKLCTSLEKPEGDLHFYNKKEYYVYSDNNGILAKGMKWNPHAAIDPNIELATREEKWEIINIPGYSTTMGTLNGMILKAFQTLEPYDDLTRDSNTVAGGINQIKDTIAKFSTLIPRQFTIVDNYGRIQSAPISTFQDTQKWISVNINGNPKKPKITIHHEFEAQPDTTSRLNKNEDIEEISSNDFDNIQLYTPKVDAKGHVVGKNIETITLPYGFKSIVADIESTAVTNLEYAADTVVAENTQDTFTIKPANKWIRLSADKNNDSIAFGHLVGIIETQEKTPTDLNIDYLNEENEIIVPEISDNDNKINIQDIEHDEAGHLTSRKDHVYTLPYGFKFITTNGTSDSVNVGTPNQNIAVALNTQDVFYIDVGNKWIKTAIDTTDNRKITLYHDVSPIDSTTSDPIDFNNISDGIFTLRDIAFDEAGHITENKPHQYTLPYSFKTFTHTNSNTNKDLNFVDENNQPYVETSHKIIADNVVDEFNFTSINKWIRLQAEEKSLKLAHLVTNVTETVDNSNSLFQESLITTENNKTFTVLEALAIDEAGHITAFNRKVFTMPNGFSKFSIKNSKENAVETNIEAKGTSDTLKINAGDRWTVLNAITNNENTEIEIDGQIQQISKHTHTLTISHADAGEGTFTYPGAAASEVSSMSYGAVFTIPSFSYDNKGHISSANTLTYKLPNISLSSTTIGNVLTGISLNSTNGAFTYTSTNVGTLSLTEYEYNSNNSSYAENNGTTLVATDSINSAFGKIVKQIENEASARVKAISDLDVEVTGMGPGKALASLEEEDGKISATFEDIAIDKNQITNLSDLIVNTPAGEGQTQIVLNAGNTISEITYNDTNNQWQYKVTPISITLSQISNLNDLAQNNDIPEDEVHLLTSLSESNGIISYTSEELNWNHISALLPAEGDDNELLTVPKANSTYLTKEEAPTLYADISLEESAYTDDTTFNYSESYFDENEVEVNYLNGNEEALNVQQLVAKVKELERRIQALENQNP